MADPEDRSSWYDVRDGRRHVRPYDFTFTSFAKRRWVGRRVLDVMSEEFPQQCTAAYLTEVMASQRLLLNGRAVHPEDTLRHGDKLEHVVVRQEPSVPAAPVQLLHCDAGLLVIDKPAGVPVHHAGRFRRNSLVEIVQAERPELRLDEACGAKGGIHVLHRLDRQTSGVLLLPRTAERAAELGALMQAGQLRKQYLARVQGRLEVGAEHEVREPIRVLSAHGATSCDCHAEGKSAAPGPHPRTASQAGASSASHARGPHVGTGRRARGCGASGTMRRATPRSCCASPAPAAPTRSGCTPATSATRSPTTRSTLGVRPPRTPPRTPPPLPPAVMRTPPRQSAPGARRRRAALRRKGRLQASRRWARRCLGAQRRTWPEGMWR